MKTENPCSTWSLQTLLKYKDISVARFNSNTHFLLWKYDWNEYSTTYWWNSHFKQFILQMYPTIAEAKVRSFSISPPFDIWLLPVVTSILAFNVKITSISIIIWLNIIQDLLFVSRLEHKISHFWMCLCDKFQ